MIRILSSDGEAKLVCMESDLLRVKLCSFGAAIFSVEIKNSDGSWEDIALTCDTVCDFMENRNFYGATVGRVVNRIKEGRATINGKTYQLTINEGKNSSHGGEYSYAWRLWDTEVLEDCVRFRLLSRDGEAGYPGNLRVEVEYRFDTDGSLLITHRGVSDQDTILNMTNHTYWCLGGMEQKIYDQTLYINGSSYLELDSELIPTGRILPVENTPFDFTTPRKIGERIFDEFPAIRDNRGYDVSFVRNGEGMGLAARLTAGARVLEVETTLPDIHIYTANFLNGDPGKGGRQYHAHDAICLEGELFPDAINHPNFGRIILEAGEQYCEQIRFRIRNN